MGLLGPPIVMNIATPAVTEKKWVSARCSTEPALGAKNLHLPLSLGTHADPSLLLRRTVWDIGLPHRVSADHGQPKGCQCSEFVTFLVFSGFSACNSFVFSVSPSGKPKKSQPLRMTVWDMGSPRRVSAYHGQPKGCRCSG